MGFWAVYEFWDKDLRPKSFSWRSFSDYYLTVTSSSGLEKNKIKATASIFCYDNKTILKNG